MAAPNLQIVLTARNLTGGAFNQLKRDVGGVMSPLRDFKALLAGTFGMISGGLLAKGFLETGIYMDRMTRALSNVQGGMKPAAESIEYLRKESERLGVVFKDQIQGFLLFSAATKGTALAGQQTRQMYSDLMESVASFQLTQEDAYQSVRAVQQMLNKGTIQAEEFRGQFAERIPAAFEALKKLLEVNDKQLGEMMKKGQLISSAIVPGLLRMMSIQSKAGLPDVTKSAQSEINRIKNTWTEFQTLVMNSGVTESIAKGLADLSSGFRDAFKDNEKEIQNFVKAALTGIKSLNGPIKSVGDTFMNIGVMDWSKTTFATSSLALIALLNIRFAALYATVQTIMTVSRQAKALGALAGGGITFDQYKSANGQELDALLEGLNSGGTEFAVKQSQVRLAEELTESLTRLSTAQKQYENNVKLIGETPSKYDKAYLDGIREEIALEEKRSKLLAASIRVSKEGVPNRSGISKEKTIIGLKAGPMTDPNSPEAIATQIREIQKATQAANNAAIGAGEIDSTSATRVLKIQERAAKVRKDIADKIAKFSRDELYQLDVQANKYSEKERKIKEITAAVENLNERLKDKAQETGIGYDSSALMQVQKDLIARTEKAYAPDRTGAISKMQKYASEVTQEYDDLLNKTKEVDQVTRGVTDAFKVQVAQIKEEYRVTGDFQDILDAILKKIRKAIEEQEKLRAAKDFGNAVAGGFLDGFSGGMDGLGDVMKRAFEDVVFDQISKSVAKNIASSISTSLNPVLSQALGGVAGAFVGAGVSMIGSKLLGSITGSKRRAERKKLHAWYKVIRENTAATERNTYRLDRGEKSTYSGGLMDLREQFQQSRTDIIKNFKSNSKLDAEAYVWALDKGRFDFGGNLQDIIKTLEEAGEATSRKRTSLKLRELAASLRELAASVDSTQRQIIETARDAFAEAGDAFRSEAEIQRRAMQKSGKDVLIGLAETFQLEGAKLNLTWKDMGFGIKLPQDRQIDDAYIDELSRLGSVQDISRKLLADLIPGTEAYNQALEASLVIYETGRLRFKDMQEGVLASARDMYQGAADGFRTESEIQKRELERQGAEFLTGLASTYSFDQAYVDNLKTLGSVQQMSQKLLGDLVPGTEAYNQVLETSLLLYETGVLKQQSYMKGLTTSVTDWQKEMSQRSWGLPEWMDEFTSIGSSIEGLNVLSDSYFSDAVNLAEKQFDALKQIASLSEAQLLELKNSSKSLEQQIWEFSKGRESDTISSSDWMARGEGLYRKAEQSLSAEDISNFQAFLPDLRDAMLASGYNYTYVTDQFKWALSTLLTKVNTSMDSMSQSIDKLPNLAPTVQPIQISLKIDGRELSNVIIDQLNTNGNLINAVRRVNGR